MTALEIREWDNPKDEERLKELYRTRGAFYAYLQKKLDEGSFTYMKRWTDGIGHLICIIEYASLDDFARTWKDPEYNELWVRAARKCDNMTCRVFRTTMSVPPN